MNNNFETEKVLKFRGTELSTEHPPWCWVGSGASEEARQAEMNSEVGLQLPSERASATFLGIAGTVAPVIRDYLWDYLLFTRLCVAVAMVIPELPEKVRSAVRKLVGLSRQLTATSRPSDTQFWQLQWQKLGLRGVWWGHGAFGWRWINSGKPFGISGGESGTL